MGAPAAARSRVSSASRSAAAAEAVVKILGSGRPPSPKLTQMWAQIGPLVSSPAVISLLSGKEVVHVFQGLMEEDHERE